MTVAHIEPTQIDRDAVLRTLNLDPRRPETQALLLVCERYGLDPLLKHMVLIQGRPYVTRDGYLHIAHSSGQLDGIEILDEGADGEHWWARVSIFRKDMARPFTYKGRYPKSGGNKNYGPEMAIKCAEVAALRRAFNVTGIGAADEKWDDPDQVVDLPPAEPTASKHDVELLQACVEELEPDQRTEFLTWKAEQDFSWPWSVAAYNQLEAKLEEIVGAGVPLEQGELGTAAAPAPTDSVGVGSSPPSEATDSHDMADVVSDAAPTLIDDDPERPF